MGLFRAIGRFFRIIGYALTGRVDQASRERSLDPHVMRARYDEVVRDKVGRLNQYKEAVAGLIALEERKKAQLKSLSEEVVRLEELKAGALAMAKKRMETLQGKGKSPEEVQHDEEYLKCRAAFSDFSSTLEAKFKMIKELESDITGLGDQIKKHKVQLQELLRDLDKMRAEREEAVAEVITAKQQQQIADMLTGIGADRTSEDVSELRELRQRARASARISEELAGTDTRVQEAQFRDFARANRANDEFDAMVGLTKAAPQAITADSVAEQPAAAAGSGGGKLPE